MGTRSIYGNTNSLKSCLGNKETERRACQPLKCEGGLKHHKINKWVVPGSEIGSLHRARGAERAGEL